MDHAITDSHSIVTIGYNVSRALQPPEETCNTDGSDLGWPDEALSGLLVLF